ncbi:MAG: hypothetical protein AB7V00_02120 [Bacilli bacterium]
MKNIIKCHFNYFINKVTIISLILVVVVSSLGFIYATEFLHGANDFASGNFYYFYNSLLITKIIGTFLFIFIVGNCFLPKNDQYSYLLITSNVTRWCYFSLKIFSFLLLIFLFVWVIFCFYVVIGFLSSSNFIFNWDYFKSFSCLILFYSYYSLLGLLFVQLTKNIYTIIIPVAIVNVLNILKENQQSLFFIYLFFPDFNDNGRLLTFGLWHTLLLILFLFMINFYIYHKKDL